MAEVTRLHSPKTNLHHLSSRTMLRPTDRLLRLCQDCNYSVEDAEEWSKVTEAEFVREESSGDGAPTFPSDFRWDAFCACLPPKPKESIFDLFPPTVELLVPLKNVAAPTVPSDAGVSVLWLSDTTFLSSIPFHLYPHSRPPCEYRVSFSPGLASCYAYSVPTFTFVGYVNENEATSSEIPLCFFKHVTAGLPTGFFTHLELMCGDPDFPPRLCSLFLSIAGPSESDDECVARTVVRLCKSFDQPIREDQLVALLAHRFSSHVKLDLGGLQGENLLERANQLLRECQHLRHLKVSPKLIDFDRSDASFTFNPHLQSLEIVPILDGGISLKLLDGFALSTGLKDLTLRFSPAMLFTYFRVAHLEKLTHLFGNVLPRCYSMRTLTLDLLEIHPGTVNRQDPHVFYEEIVRCIAAFSTTRAKDPFGSVSSIKVTLTPFPVSGFTERGLPPGIVLGSVWLKKRVLPPNATWDRLVSPSLVLTWRRDQRRKEHPAKRLQPLGLIVPAIRQINQDVAYQKTSTVAPYDSRTANASVIYDSIRSFHPAFGSPSTEHMSQRSVEN
jgi:hypothetical protein